MADNFKKINMGQPIFSLKGEPLLMAGMLQAGEQMEFMIGCVNESGISDDARALIMETLKKKGLEPMTLAHICCNALVQPGEGGKPHLIAEHIKRQEYIKKCWRPGLAKFKESDAVYVEEIVARAYPGALIAAQVHDMLRGIEVNMKMAEGNEDDEIE